MGPTQSSFFLFLNHTSYCLAARRMDQSLIYIEPGQATYRPIRLRCSGPASNSKQQYILVQMKGRYLTVSKKFPNTKQVTISRVLLKFGEQVQSDVYALSVQDCNLKSGKTVSFRIVNLFNVYEPRAARFCQSKCFKRGSYSSAQLNQLTLDRTLTSFFK